MLPHFFEVFEKIGSRADNKCHSKAIAGIRQLSREERTRPKGTVSNDAIRVTAFVKNATLDHFIMFVIDVRLVKLDVGLILSPKPGATFQARL